MLTVLPPFCAAASRPLSPMIEAPSTVWTATLAAWTPDGWPAMVELPAGVPAWWFYVAMCVAVVVIGIAKSGFGGGVGILAVPLVASALPSNRAVAVMLPILISADIVAVWQHRRHVAWPAWRHSFLGALAGIAVGTVLLLWLANTGLLVPALNLVIGLVCLAFVGLYFYRLSGGYVPRVPDRPANAAGFGAAAGVVSTLAHAAGPIMTIYFLETRLDKKALVATLVVFFFAMNCAKLPTYLLLDDLITPATLATSLLFIPLIPLGSLLGLWMHHRVPEKPFTLIMYVGTALSAAYMLYKAAA